jgi:ArsR family transcriptional regulator, arsenate/arsenite/antimonite-responsive transcriptional repressor
MNTFYRALSDPTRRGILRLLRERDMSAGELAEKFPQSKPAMSKHFSVLKDAELIQGRRNGTTIIYTLNVSVLEEAVSALMDTFSIQPKPSTRKGSSHVRATPRTAE